MDLLCLCVVAGFAGFVDAVVGGGGLIQLPALFVFLPPSLAANAASVLGTNKLSSICGTSMAAAQYSCRIPINWQSIFPAGVTASVFSSLGARAVTRIDPSVLKPVLLVLLVAVAAYTFVRRDLGNLHAPQFTARREARYAVLTGMAIGFYDGFFGPGTGSFLIFIFIGLFGFDFLTASASAKVINLATNLAAVGYFALTDHVLYRYGLPMAACNVLGALLGSRLAILKGNAFVRGFFLLVVGAMICRYGYAVLFR